MGGKTELTDVEDNLGAHLDWHESLVGGIHDDVNL